MFASITPSYGLIFLSLYKYTFANSNDQVFRAQQIRAYMEAGNEPPNPRDKPKTPAEAARKAAHFYSMLQTEDGHWAGDYGGPHFLMPGLIVAW